MKAASVTVLDAEGRKLSPTTAEKARRLLAEGKAKLVSEDPFAIQLSYGVELPPQPKEIERAGEGRRILLHICCAPCATYPVQRLREEGFEVTGFWYNPNVHPWTEHERRRESLVEFAQAVGLPVIWHDRYEMPLFLRAVAGHEKFGERCRICYRMRLERTAQVAAEDGFDAFTTTLLISPYQDQALIGEIGEEVASERGVEFHFENFRRGWSERGRLTKEYDLYHQQYCGCIYSEWERYNKAPIEVLLTSSKSSDLASGSSPDATQLKG